MAKLLIPILFVLAILPAGGWSGPLQSPELNPPSKLTEKQQKHYAHLTKFMRKPMKFIDGRFFGAHSHSFRLGGTMSNAASCLWLMHEVGVWEILVVTKPLDRDDVALSISQLGGGPVTVFINSAREDYVAKDFERFRPQPLEALKKKIKE